VGSIREQVSSLTVEELTAAQLAQVGGKVFMSANAVSDQGTMNALTEVWRSVHAPTYGVPMPGSGKTVNGSGATMLDPATNETAYVNGMSLHNASATDAATFTIYLQNAMFATGAIPPQSAVVVVGFGAEATVPFYMANGQALTVNFSGAGAADASWIVSYSLAVQA